MILEPTDLDTIHSPNLRAALAALRAARKQRKRSALKRAAAKTMQALSQPDTIFAIALCVAMIVAVHLSDWLVDLAMGAL